MPIRRAKTSRSVTTATMEYEGEQAVVTFDPRRFSYGMKLDLEEAIREGDNRRIGRLLLPLLADLLVAWEVYDEHGQPEPITLDNLKTFHEDFLIAVFVAIQKEMSPNPTSPENSVATSPPGASSGPALVGTTSSAPPVTSASPSGSWNGRPHFGATGR